MPQHNLYQTYKCYKNNLGQNFRRIWPDLTSKNNQMKKNKINVDLLLKNERSTIDRLDAIIINTLIERFSVTKRIGLIKAENNIEPHDGEREQEQVKTLEKLIGDSDLDKEFIVNLMNLITTESKKKHEQIKKEIGE